MCCNPSASAFGGEATGTTTLTFIPDLRLKDFMERASTVVMGPMRSLEPVTSTPHGAS